MTNGALVEVYTSNRAVVQTKLVFILSAITFTAHNFKTSVYYRYGKHRSAVSSEDEYWSSGFDFEAAYRLVH